MDSPSPPPGSRERMVEATIALMRRSGLSGAGINEIVRESGAPKGSASVVSASLCRRASGFLLATSTDPWMNDRRSIAP